MIKYHCKNKIDSNYLKKFNIIKIIIWYEMFAIALGMSPVEKITVAISSSIFIIAFIWVSIKGDLRKLANELIEDNENNQDN